MAKEKGWCPLIDRYARCVECAWYNGECLISKIGESLAAIAGAMTKNDKRWEELNG